MEKSKSNKLCNNPECNTRANFNFKKLKKPIYCSKHKENGMINVESTWNMLCKKDKTKRMDSTFECLERKHSILVST